MTEPVRRVTVRTIERDMGGAVWNPRTRWSRKVMLLAFVEDGAGRLGVGEAWLHEGGAGAIRSIIEDDLAPLVVGRSPLEARGLTETVFRAAELSGRTGASAAAWGALDAALWDLAARQLDLPLADLLGRAHRRVPVYASAGLYGEGKTPETLGEEVAGWVAQGFTSVKIKVGGASVREDAARVAACREAIGPDVRLMVDALYNCTAAGAIALARAFEPNDVHFLEAPVAPSDIAGMARVNAASPIPVCGNENMAWAPYFRDLILARATEFVQFDVAACGGVTEAKRIGELAHCHGLPATLHASSTSALYAISLHVAASLPGIHSVEHHMLHQWFWERAPGGTWTVENGTLAPPAGPGIGIDLTPDDL